MKHTLAVLLLLSSQIAPAIEPDSESGNDLARIRRIHVERLSGGETADQIRDMIISCLQNIGLFQLTEDPERADAILRGSAEDLIFNETHDTREGIDARGSFTIGRPSAGANRSSRGFSVNSGLGEDEASRTVERRHEATAAVRLVNREGDVIWSTVQESQGAKFSSASLDVSERVGRELEQDFRRISEAAEAGAPATP